MGVVCQNPDDQLFMPTVYDEIAFGLRNRKLGEQKIAVKVASVLEQLQISHLEKKMTTKLSGGEKRMVALATVLVMEPEVIIFDEPTAFLDPKARRILLNILNKLPQTKIVATHDLSFALEACRRCLVLKDGELAVDGSTEDVLFDQSGRQAWELEAIEIFRR